MPGNPRHLHSSVTRENNAHTATLGKPTPQNPRKRSFPAKMTLLRFDGLR